MPEPRIKGSVRGGRGGRGGSGGRGDQTPTLEAVGRQLRNTRQRAAAAAGRGSEPARGRGRGRGRKGNLATRGKGRRGAGVRLVEEEEQLERFQVADIDRGEEGDNRGRMGDDNGGLSANRVAGQEEEGSTAPFPERVNILF